MTFAIHYHLRVFRNGLPDARMVLEEGLELRMLGEVGVVRSELRVLAQVTIDLRMFVKKLVERLDLPGRNVTTSAVPPLLLAQNCLRVLSGQFAYARVLLQQLCQAG